LAPLKDKLIVILGSIIDNGDRYYLCWLLS